MNYFGALHDHSVRVYTLKSPQLIRRNYRATPGICWVEASPSLVRTPQPRGGAFHGVDTLHDDKDLAPRLSAASTLAILGEKSA